MTTISPPVGAASPAATAFGHPRGLTILFSTELWERFSYYGMRSLLVLYMTKQLLDPAHASRVLGLESFRSALGAVFGPLGRQAFASQIFGFYGGLVYLTPILGGVLADRWLGRRVTVVVGAALMAAGHFMMAFEPLFLLALLLLILGNGAFKPNISSQVGRLYAHDDPRRDRAYSIFYLGINIGAFLAPLVCGTLGEGVGWHFGFGAAGVGMLLALVIYLAGLRWLPPEPARRSAPPTPSETGQGTTAQGETARHDGRAVAAILALFVPATLFWAVYYQMGNVLPLWIDASVDRHVNLLFWHGEIPTTWFQAFNPMFIFTLTPLVVSLWARQARRGREPTTVTKMAIGCLLLAAAFGLLAALASGAHDAPAAWPWLLVFFAVGTVGELYLSPIGLSLVSKIAPLQMLSALMGLWLATSFSGSLLAGWFGTAWEAIPKPAFFLVCAAVAALAGALFWTPRRYLGAMIDE